MHYLLNLKGNLKVSNSHTLANLPGVHEDNVKGDIGLRVSRKYPNGECEFTLLGPSIDCDGSCLTGVSQHPMTDIFGLVEECRQKWKTAVVEFSHQTSTNGESKYEFPFKERWDFTSEPGFVNAIAAQLARAGENLFISIFETNCNERLTDIARVLRRKLSEKDRYIAVTSSDLFLPWSMLYTHPRNDEELAQDGSNWKKEGFWGYRHIIQQSPENIKLENRILPDSTGELALSVNFDNRLPLSLNMPAIDEHIDSISHLTGKKCLQRTKKTELAVGFNQNRDSLERILYFYCHGRGSTSSGTVNLSVPHLVMTDDNVSAPDFQRWSKGRILPTSPLIFINACQGGQMTTMFYESFAVELLKEGAVGLIGAQIDIPAVFASAYAHFLLEAFFAKDKGRVRLGPLMQEMNQKMLDIHNNPLGLAYSLYRGVDCYIDWLKPNQH
jgi:hypothetical protein